MLEGLDLDYEQLDPIKRGLCGAPAPIRVKSIGKEPAVAISPPATMTCKLAVALHAWFKDTVQPSASELGTSVVKIRNASSYKCRNRYGRTDTRISEHALANALDISEFVFASGRRIKLLGNWPYGTLRTLTLTPDPPTPNPQRTGGLLDANDRGLGTNAFGRAHAATTGVNTNPFVRPVVEASHSPLPAQDSTQDSTQDPTHGSPQGTNAIARSPITTVNSNPFVSPLPKPGAQQAVAEAKPQEANKQEAVKSDQTPRAPTIGSADAAAFLKILHIEACKTFETVLGPDANAAHKDHFHLDMKKRRYVKICE